MMKCPDCGGTKEWTPPDRPYCNECDIKRRTCTKCGELVENFAVWVTGENGKEVGRGHRECFETIQK